MSDWTDIPLGEPTDKEIHAFTEAWEAERQKIGRGIAPKGTKTRAGLRAAYAARKDRLALAYQERAEAQMPEAPEPGVTYMWDGGKWHAVENPSSDVIRNHVLIELNALASQLDNDGAGRSALTVRKRTEYLRSTNRTFEEPPAREHIDLRSIPKSGDVTYDQRLWHLALIENGEDVDQNIEWLRTSLKVGHEQQTTQPARLLATLTLSPRPWLITNGAGGATAGTRFQNSSTIPTGAQFRFEPETGYEQDVHRYPQETYGPTTGIKQDQRDPEAIRLSLLSLIAVQEIDETSAQHMRDQVNALTSLATPGWLTPADKPRPKQADITDQEIYAERLRQVERGYDIRHDDEHGLRHLLLWAIDYGKRRETTKSLALIRAALEHMARHGVDL